MLQKLWYSALLSNSIIFFSLATIPQEPENIIQSVTINKRLITVSINESFKKAWLVDDFFAQYERNIDLRKMPKSIVLLPFILNIYPIVWISGKDYSIDCMDEDTYYSLERIKKVLQRLYPNTPLQGNLIPKTLKKNHPSVPLVDNKTHVAILYSTGLDSTACSFEHYDKHQLLITARGQKDLGKTSNRGRNRKIALMKYARDRGYTNAFIKSNYAKFLNWDVLNTVSEEITSWKVDTTEGVGLFGLAAPILFTRGYSTLLIGSSFVWDYPFPTAANPLVDDNLKAASVLSLKHLHFDLNRFDKVKLIVDLVKTKNLKVPFMKVCDYRHDEENCCEYCAKCQTVMNALFALGENPSLYGFNVTSEEIVERTKEYFAHGQGYWTSWNFADMQRKLRALPEVPKKAQWLLSYDFMKHTSYYLAGAKTRVNWPAFKDLAPDNLKIPTTHSSKVYDDAHRKKKQVEKKRAYARLMLKKGSAEHCNKLSGGSL